MFKGLARHWHRGIVPVVYSSVSDCRSLNSSFKVFGSMTSMCPNYLLLYMFIYYFTYFRWNNKHSSNSEREQSVARWAQSTTGRNKWSSHRCQDLIGRMYWGSRVQPVHIHRSNSRAPQSWQSSLIAKVFHFSLLMIKLNNANWRFLRRKQHDFIRKTK